MDHASSTMVDTGVLSATAVASRNRDFLTLLPAIRRDAQIAFRHVSQQIRDEAVLDVVAYAFVEFCRLTERGVPERAFASALARYGIAQVKCGRRVGVRFNVRDIMGWACQVRHDFHVESLTRWSDTEDGWQEMIVEDHRATPAEVAAWRIDISTWLASLPRRTQVIAKLLANGESTSGVARRFRVTAARISQVRRELEEAWRHFQGEPELAAT
jgi:hypothetical protein